MFTLNIRRKSRPRQPESSQQTSVAIDRGFRKDLRAYGQIIQQFTRTVRNLEQAYLQLQRRVEILTGELQKKQVELHTERQYTQQIRSQLDYVLLSMKSGVIAVDRRGRITVFNRAAEAITGLPAQKVLGKPYANTVQAALGFQRSPLTALAERREYLGLEERISARAGGNGRSCFVRRSVTLIRNREQETIGAMEILEDITALKQLQMAHQKASNWNALGEMARQFAHKVRNPLGGIMGFASLLERDFAEDDPRRMWVKKIQEGAGRLDKYIADLLLFTRPLTPERSLQDLRRLVRQSLESTEAKGKEVVCQMPEGEPLQLETDSRLFKEIFGHILEFAVTWAEDDSRITVACMTDSSDHIEFQIAFRPITGQRAIEHKQEEDSADWFSREEGLALAIARRLTELLDGTFEVGAQGEHQITIRVVFPR